MAERNRPLQQVALFAAGTARALETICIFERFLCGAGLLAPCGRLRHSDLARLTFCAHLGE
eukprot:11187602-Lingulodinium_polyedra.AAC.1